MLIIITVQYYGVTIDGNLNRFDGETMELTFVLYVVDLFHPSQRRFRNRIHSTRGCILVLFSFYIKASFFLGTFTTDRGITFA